MNLRSNFNRSIAELYTKEEIAILWRRVLSAVCKIEISKSYFYTDADITEKQAEEIEKIAKRLALGEPLEYILGFAEFCSKIFKVTRATLIPRLETQEIVDFIKKTYNTNKELEIIDIGTGSGCIAIMLALIFPSSKVKAIDISAEALKVAKSNAEALGARKVEFVECDFIKSGASLGSEYDIIVSNPPYVRPSEKRAMPKRVLDYEPSGALFVSEDDPLLFYREIARWSKRHLKPAGIVVVEINQWLSKETAALFAEQGYQTEIVEDLYSNPRIIIAS